MKQSKQDAGKNPSGPAALDPEPLRILVVGPKKAGKSSLDQRLVRRISRRDDVVPRTDGVEPYVLDREGLQEAIVLDTAGYDIASPARSSAARPS